MRIKKNLIAVLSAIAVIMTLTGSLPIRSGGLPDTTITVCAASGTGVSSLPTSSGTYYLTQDITLNDPWNVPSETTILDLNGHKIILNNVVFNMTSTSTNLEIKDTATGGEIKQNGTKGIFWGTWGSLTISGGKVTGTSSFDSAIIANDGDVSVNKTYATKVTLQGGELVCPYSDAISLWGSGEINLAGGKITSTSTQTGMTTSSAVLPRRTFTGTVNWTGTEIVTNVGCGVYVRDSNTTVNVTGGSFRTTGTSFPTDGGYAIGGNAQGAINISGALNLGGKGIYLLDGKKITITNTLSNTTPIGVTMQKPDVFTNSSTTSYNDLSKFTSNDGTYVVGKNTNNQLLLAKLFTVTYNANGHGTAPAAVQVASGSKITEPTAPTASGYTFKGWYKEASCTNEWIFGSDTVTNAITLYAKWTANPTYSVSEKTLTYNGSAQALVTTTGSGGMIYYHYKKDSGNYTGWQNSIPSVIDAGTYTIQWYSEGDSTYNAKGSTSSPAGTVTTKISQITATLEWTNTSFTYDGKSHVPTASVSNLVSGDSCTVTVTGGQTNVGNYTATASSLNNSNYALPATKTQSFSITKATNNTWKTAAQAATPTYDGTAKTLLATNPAATFGSVEYSTDNSTWQSGVPTKTDAGTYTVYYRVKDTTNYNGVTGNVSATIKKATPATTHLTYTEPSNLTYNGSGKTAGFSLNSPYTQAGTITAEYQKSGTSDWTTEAPTEAGTYNVRANVAGGDNFNAGYVPEWSFTIERADPVVTAPEKIDNLIFTGTDQPLIEAGSTTGGTLVYSLDNVNYQTDIPTGKNVGKYTVYYKVLENNNYNPVSEQQFDVYINPAYTVTIPADIYLTGENRKVTGTGEVKADYKIGTKQLRVRINSKNNFHLNGTEPVTNEISVPYTITKDGNAAALAQDSEVISVTNLGETTASLNFDVDTTKMYAGKYADVLTFSISLSDN